jgi:hypothetical protein
MQAISDIFSIWPSLSVMAGELGQPYDRVQKWHARKRIPVTAWPVVIEKAAMRETLVTMPELAAMNRAKRKARRNG